jgi:hypothetical protein
MISLDEMSYYELLDERSAALAAIKQIKSLESISQEQQDRMEKPLWKVIRDVEKQLEKNS